MTTNVYPVSGGWYKQLDKNYKCQVVAFNDTAGIVELQHCDGEVATLEIDDSGYRHIRLSDDDWHQGPGERHEDHP